jgi:electron transfer flavoprotein alpha subunit
VKLTLKIWSFAEELDQADEVSSVAEGLASSSGGQSVVLELAGGPKGVHGSGEKIVLKLSNPLSRSPEQAAGALAAAVRAAKPDVVLLAATRDGRETASRLAVRLGWPCLSEVYGLSVSGGALRGTRNVFAGKCTATVEAGIPCVATLKMGVAPRADASPRSTTQLDVGQVDAKTTVVEHRKKEGGRVDLRSAKVIVSIGRGLKKKDDLPLIEGLAAAAGGAVGCSRPLSSDMGWLPEEHHIGLTGATVKPDLYLAIGISGQLQHIAGIKDSKIIAAVNIDKGAPIFQSADYGIVGDLYQVVPALSAALKARRS